MSSSSRLDPHTAGRLKQMLEERRRSLRDEVRANMLGSDDDRVVGLARRIQESDDWGVADGLAELDIAETRHSLAELTAVDAALARIASGSYGDCIDCGEPIGAARLLAYPMAERCIRCQQAFELRSRGPAATAR